MQTLQKTLDKNFDPTTDANAPAKTYMRKVASKLQPDHEYKTLFPQYLLAPETLRNSKFSLSKNA